MIALPDTFIVVLHDSLRSDRKKGEVESDVWDEGWNAAGTPTIV